MLDLRRINVWVRSHKVLTIIFSALMGAAAAVAWLAAFNATESRQLLREAQAAIRTGRYQHAREVLSTISPQTTEWIAAQLLAGEAAYRAGDTASAIAHYSNVTGTRTHSSAVALVALAELYRDTGRISEAEAAYRSALQQRPGEALVHQRLALVLGMTGRRWESTPHFMFLLKNRAWSLPDLCLIGDLERPTEQKKYLERCSAVTPNDVHVLQGLAQMAVVYGQADRARRLLHTVVAEAPELASAHAMLGELLVDDSVSAFQQWHSALPPNADSHPDIWYVRGLWARRCGAVTVAIRCFWEAIRLAPTHRRATYLLGQVLLARGESSGPEVARRASQLSELGQHLDLVLRSGGRDHASLKKTTELMEATGRAWEACAWAATAQRFFPRATWPEGILARVSPKLLDDPPQVLESQNLALRFDYSAFPDHSTLLHIRDRQDDSGRTHRSAAIQFHEESGIGIDFAYFNGADPSTPGARMFEQSGGGVAVLDYDADDFPDLYFTQGAAWKHGDLQPSPSSEQTDRIYRNHLGCRFEDVTAKANLGCADFGQGPSVGDFNSDGFADLYIANLGRNRLYVNNGDGTFQDISRQAGLSADQWTASCLVADLNADGHPDLFDVNYVSGGRRVFEMICEGKACGPQSFEGTPPLLHLNAGDGTFVAQSVDVPESHAKGLGVVAAALEPNGRSCLFIANDQVPNFMLQNLPGGPHDIRLEDRGFYCGFAYNEHGLPLGSMGIAADDVDGNGHVDFLVTNFHEEYNTLYLQDSPGLFVDATNAAGLMDSSYALVAWGTQFLDADRDGLPDIVVTNGHIDDYRDQGGQYHMPPQFYRNLGDGRFELLPPAGAGAYFEREYLGRGLARLDWNGDGRMDFVVSNIRQPASLVTNHTSHAGHYLNVRLHATQSARDAVGAFVELDVGEELARKQLCAGDGYMASNERLLQFGLADARSLRELRVFWPSGTVTTLRDLDVDQTIEVVENGQVRFR